MTTTDATNHQVRLAARPTGTPTPDVWAHTEEPVAEPGEGQLVVRVSHISLDPAMRGWMDDRPSYVPPVGLNEVMRALGAGEVVASSHPDFPVGTHVSGMFGVQEYALSDGRGLLAVDPSAAPMSTYLAALGMTGMTAYFGLFDVGAAKQGDTVLVSGAAGAVGTMVGQLAKIRGCRVVGIAGGAAKCALLTDELGFDAALDYREEGLARRLREATPDGVQVFFDNVGGEVLDAGLTRISRGARVVLCGAISQYNSRERVAGPTNYLSLLVNRARMEGFIVFDFADRYAEAAAEIAGWLREGRLRSKEDVVTGSVADFPATLLRLFRGENVGKLVLQIA
ncbi:NADP-dependent oxidoreductase [Pseudonocardia acaciae]|uniref:NADP-dependent oxidoreductase n=1 Tax=Pseudonocardia acaciae TaxID=551276 RepID=UPI000A8C9960|nr:NADP-dependent oxidoreductase [Pseudonocardia acaciae]